MGKKRILLLSDDLRSPSGIGIMSKEIVMNTLWKYDWIQLGARMSNEDEGKIIDFSKDIRERYNIPDANLLIIPNNGYGDIIKLRSIMAAYKPDAILHFTDPHYWQWLYDAEHEIRQTTPILYYHIWDNLPDPDYNRNYYESCDWIGCISKQTYGIVHRVGKNTSQSTFKPLRDDQISYVPHGINQNTFKPLDNISPDVYNLINERKKYDFILFYNNRNIRRKQPGDVILAYKMFCDSLPKSEAQKCLLLMHTTPIDENGTDLLAVKQKLCPEYDVLFNSNKYEQNVLNEFYNLVDCTINISNNEGFGLGTMESIMAGTPVIVTVTGGLQEQCGLNLDGQEFTADDYIKIGSLHEKAKWGSLNYGEWCVPIWTVSQTLNGSPMTPYIFDDRFNINDVSDAILKVYRWGREERKRRGLVGREWALSRFSANVMCNKMIEGIDQTINNFKPKNRFELYKIV